MGLTNSLYTGLTGLNANSFLISVTGNNIANVNTHGFKVSRANFETEISDTLGQGSGPSANLGGTNPTQIGLGTRLGSVTRNFSDGSLQPTGVNTEMAIEGAGLFIVKDNGIERYTRSGTFKLDSNFNLVNGNGALVQGYDIDSNYGIIPGAVTSLKIPLGNLSLTEQTRNVRFGGNLNASGNAAVNGAVVTSNTLYSDSAATTLALATDALTTLYKSGSATPLFVTGDVITLTGATKGGATLPDATFEVGATNTTGSNANGTTLQEFMDFLQGVIGIDTNITGTTAGVTISSGQLRLEGNTGSVNDFAIANADVIVNQSTSPSLPFTFSQSQSADGESVRTTFVAYDSLGSPMNLDLSLVLEAKSNSGSAWRFFAQSQDDSDVSRVLGNGTLTFNTNGELTDVTGNTISIDRAGTAATPIQSINLAFDNPAGAVSALADVTSQLSALSQDGTARGILNDFSVRADGTIIGIFSNSQTRSLGQVVLANFANPEGLLDVGNGLFTVTSSSGEPQRLAPGTGGVGDIVGGALELSNVDLSQEFINLITGSTGFSANSRVLSTSDRLIQELLATIR